MKEKDENHDEEHDTLISHAGFDSLESILTPINDDTDGESMGS